MFDTFLIGIAVVGGVVIVSYLCYRVCVEHSKREYDKYYDDDTSEGLDINTFDVRKGPIPPPPPPSTMKVRPRRPNRIRSDGYMDDDDTTTTLLIAGAAASVLASADEGEQYDHGSGPTYETDTTPRGTDFSSDTTDNSTNSSNISSSVSSGYSSSYDSSSDSGSWGGSDSGGGGCGD